MWLEPLSADTPKVKKPVSASGIFALTQSPLLYKKSAVSSEAAQRNGEAMKVYVELKVRVDALLDLTLMKMRLRGCLN